MQWINKWLSIEFGIESIGIRMLKPQSKGLVKLHLQPDALNSELYITNTAGQIVFKMKITFITDFSIDLSSVSKGIYFIHIGGDGKQSQKSKLIIQ